MNERKKEKEKRKKVNIIELNNILINASSMIKSLSQTKEYVTLVKRCENCTPPQIICFKQF